MDTTHGDWAADKKSGLVQSDGNARPADFAEHLMAEAIDGAVELIVSLTEEHHPRRMSPDPGRVADVMGAIDDRLCDVGRKVSVAAAEPLAGDGEGHVLIGLGPWREFPTRLRSRAEALTTRYYSRVSCRRS